MSLFGAVWMADLRIDRPYLPITGKNHVLDCLFMAWNRGKEETGGFWDCRLYEPGSGLCRGLVKLFKKIRIIFSAVEVNHRSSMSPKDNTHASVSVAEWIKNALPKKTCFSCKGCEKMKIIFG